MSKKPKQKEYPTLGKTPTSTVSVSSHMARPTWRFSLLDIDGPFGTGKESLAKINLAEVIWPKLRDFESMTWKEIVGNGSHKVAVSDLAVAARKKLTKLNMDDIEELFSLRLMGKQRIWGILDNNAFRILWWDPDHLVCPSTLKNT